MGRPLTGKTHVGIRRETRSNGDVYVYERVTGYGKLFKTPISERWGSRFV